jgi:hypothetical protein
MLANVADIVSATAVIGGAGFALIQLRQYRTQRRDNAAVELVRSFYNPEFARSVRLIRALPDVCSAQRSWSEWFEWLADQLAARAREGKTPPAYEAFSGWRPSS